MAPKEPQERRRPSAAIRIFELGALAGIALLGYAVYSGLVEIPGQKASEPVQSSIMPEKTANGGRPELQNVRISAPVRLQGAPASRPANEQAPGLSISASQFFERQSPTDQSRFSSCIQLAGHEWRKVFNAVQAGLEPISSQVATCMLSLNPGRLCEPSELQALVAFLNIYTARRIEAAEKAPGHHTAHEQASQQKKSDAMGLRTETATAALDKRFVSDLQDLISQGYLKISDLGVKLPVEVQAALADVTVERVACR